MAATPGHGALSLRNTNTAAKRHATRCDTSSEAAAARNMPILLQSPRKRRSLRELQEGRIVVHEIHSRCDAYAAYRSCIVFDVGAMCDEAAEYRIKKRGAALLKRYRDHARENRTVK